MRKGRRFGTASLGFNATPMVDVIFTLTIFFMLVARFSTAEHVPMELPQPADSQARMIQHPRRVVINCVLSKESAPGGHGVLYSLGSHPPEPLTAITDRLIVMKRQSPNLQAVIRADRRLAYAEVRAVMRTLADVGIEILNVAARMDEEG